MYWIAFDRTGSSRLSHQILSWPTALLIVRSYDSLPQVEEIEVFLEHLFTSWYESPTLRRAFKAFGRYLWFRVANLQGCLPASQPFDFGPPHDLPLEEYSDLGLYDTLEYEKTESLRAFGVFQTKHPQEPSCYFTDKPITEFQSPINAENRFQTNGDATTGGSETEYNTVDDYVEEPLPQWSALPLPRTFAAPGTKAPSESMDT